jgi:SAM-dependent methyltransferase
MTSAGRLETIRYHQDLYARHDLDDPSTWLGRPSPFVLRAIAAAATTKPALVLDLGCGIGRHTIPAAQALPAGSRVIGVDLLPIATARLKEAAEAAYVSVQPVVADLETFAIAPESADLVISCSALEHVSSKPALEAALVRWQRMTRVGGLHCLVVGCDKREVCADGSTRPAIAEFELTRSDAGEMLERCYRGWEQVEYAVDHYSVTETRDGLAYRLESVCLRLLARRA